MVNNQKGMTLAELVVGMAIFGLIFVSVMNVFDKSIQLGNKLSDQSLTQLDAQDTLNRMVDGFTYNQQSIDGLREALDVVVTEDNLAIGYLTTSANVSYYLDNDILYRVVNEEPGGSAEAEESGGTVVLRYVKLFEVSPDASNERLINITLETEQGTGINKTGIKLITSILVSRWEID